MDRDRSSKLFDEINCSFPITRGVLFAYRRIFSEVKVSEQPRSETRYLSIEYRLLPDESFKGQNVKVCEKYEVAAVKMPGSDSETRRESTIRYWLNDEGPLKSENFYRNVSERGTSTSWIKNEWEIDPTIKVSLPAKFAPLK